MDLMQIAFIQCSNLRASALPLGDPSITKLECVALNFPRADDEEDNEACQDGNVYS